MLRDAGVVEVATIVVDGGKVMRRNAAGRPDLLAVAGKTLASIALQGLALWA
jgi:hypothetical protein